MTPDELKQIRTIVIVMMENRSFDHVLGHLSLPQYGARDDIEGLRDLRDPRWRNPDRLGQPVPPFLAEDAQLTTDVPHELEDVTEQLGAEGGVLRMNGFVRAYQRAEQVDGDPGFGGRPPPMAVLLPEAVPVTGWMAENFLVCNRWFAPLPTSTQPNRLMALSGFSRLDHTHSGLLPEQPTVFDWLEERQVRWRSYTAGLSFWTLMPSMWKRLVGRDFHGLGYDASHLARDFADEPDDTWPDVVFIEPEYQDTPVHRRHPCDNHAPLAVRHGERFLYDVLTALQGNPERWKETVVIVTSDEHGGFFDHVVPGRVRYRCEDGTTGPIAFDTTGVRVPALVVSPFVAPRSVSGEWLDHTSILQLLAERFDPHGSFSPEVDARKAQGIRSVSAVLSPTPYDVPPPAPPAVDVDTTAPASAPASTHGRKAMREAAQQLYQEHPEVEQWHPGLSTLTDEP